MLKRTEGIVLRTIPFGEADLIVTHLTPDFGIIKLFAKSPRKIKSRFGSSLEPLTHARIAFWGKEDTALPRLTQSDILHPFHSIRDSLDCFLKVSQLIELTLSFMPERDANKRVYALLFNTLIEIEATGFAVKNLLAHHFRIKLLDLVGFAPKLDVCGRCGSKGDTFYISQGSLLCAVCARGMDSPIRLSPAVRKLYSDLLTWDTTKIHRIKPSDRLMSELSGILTMHITYVLARPLRTASFLQSVH
jgi:DNA repair protein RecO (recombination protein O)